MVTVFSFCVDIGDARREIGLLEVKPLVLAGLEGGSR